MPDELLGRDISGKYRVLSIIGRGGMATVYLAQQLNVPRRVAIKMANPALIQDAVFVQRFRREVAATASLEHEPHILPVYDVGEGDGLLYIVMPFISGGTLKDKIIKNGGRPWSSQAVLDMARQILSALQYAHERGFVHRDVKPSNILLEGERAYLADFGIARAISESAASSQGFTLTASGIIGTPDYMAPEQALGQRVDHRADLYAFGIVLYELFTGGVPFSGTTPIEIAVKHTQGAVPPPRTVNPALSPAIEQVLLKALSREPEARYTSARELSDALDGAVAQRSGPNAQPWAAGEDATVAVPSNSRSGWLAPVTTAPRTVAPSQATNASEVTSVSTAVKPAPGAETSVAAVGPQPGLTEALPARARQRKRPAVTRRHVVVGIAAVSVAVGAGLYLRDKSYGGGPPRELPTMVSARSFFTMTALANGEILVSGGQTDQDTYRATAERYDLGSNTWADAGQMATSRAGHTATLMPNGQVLVVGGQVSGNPQVFSAASERYDPPSNRWSTGAGLSTPRLLHSTVLLPDGRLLVIGGFSGSEYLPSTEILDAGAERWVSTSPMSTPRVAAASVLLPTGEVLVVGGFTGSGYLASAEKYDPVADRWSEVAPMSTARVWHSATVMPQGWVLVVGGYVSDQRAATFYSSVEAYDWSEDSWSAGGSLSTARSAHTATLLNNGQLLVVGGQNGRPLASAELFDGDNASWTQARQMTTPRTQHEAVLLPDGNVMVAGGQTSANSSQATATAEQYEPKSGRWSLPGTT